MVYLEIKEPKHTIRKQILVTCLLDQTAVKGNQSHGGALVNVGVNAGIHQELRTYSSNKYL